MNIINNLKANIRWFIAQCLDRFPDVCWADAASWALFPEHHDFSEVLESRNTAGSCEAGGDLPYCGKCAVLKQPHIPIRESSNSLAGKVQTRWVSQTTNFIHRHVGTWGFLKEYKNVYYNMDLQKVCGLRKGL